MKKKVRKFLEIIGLEVRPKDLKELIDPMDPAILAEVLVSKNLQQFLATVDAAMETHSEENEKGNFLRISFSVVPPVLSIGGVNTEWETFGVDPEALGEGLYMDFAKKLFEELQGKRGFLAILKSEGEVIFYLA